MRVLRFAHHGVVTAWRERESALAATGCEVTLVSARRWNEGGQLVALQPAPDEAVQGVRTWGSHPNLFLYSPLGLWRALGSDVDLIDIHEEPVSVATAQIRLLARLRGIRAPYVLYSAQNIDKRYPPPFRWWERSALTHAAGAHVCNSDAVAILRSKGLRGPCVPLGLGVSEDFFSSEDRMPPDPGRPVVGFVGRLAAHKGVDVLLDAVARIPEARLEITGDGPLRSQLEQRARSLGMGHRTAFLGFAEGAALVERYRRLDVLAVPSRDTPRWREQFGRVAAEGMAAGVPVVASRAGALPDVIDGAGMLVPQDDPPALAAALQDAAGPSWLRLRESGLRRARDFSWSSIALRQRALYDEVCDPAAAPDPDVLIVAYGDPSVLGDCLAQLDGTLAVTVVDNGSSEQTRRIAERAGAVYVDAGGNVGFGAGVNRGLEDRRRRGLQGDVLLLNPDARIDAKAVRLMQRRLRATRDCAAVGASQTEPGTGHPVRVWWPFPTPVGAWIEAVGLGRLRRSHGFVIGSVLLLRAEALDQLGGMDERFFLYAEETDWQRRARDAGWMIELAEVAATHVGGGTGGDPRRREAHFYGSAERYVRKHHGAAGWAVYRAANVAGAALRGMMLPGARGQQARRRRRIFSTGPVRWESAT
ncbi:glycosyltransferase [Demequina sp. NBRC 110053]|uniref:glycosyltransferase n=1 Tax=Demequina sp. NBRC 110053 TaxID=1570342 RepID=UPI001F3C11F8|nr:glycosyltransferase [Demequina sp. NBRC 110053]